MSDQVKAEVAELLRLEDRTLHDAWKAAGGGDTFFGQVVTRDEQQNKAVYVKLANGWLERATAVNLHRAAVHDADWATLDRMYLKILKRRDQLVMMGYGSPTPGTEKSIAERAEELLKNSGAGDELKELGAIALAGLGLLLVIVILK